MVLAFKKSKIVIKRPKRYDGNNEQAVIMICGDFKVKLIRVWK